MATTTQLMTAEELLDIPDDGFRYELVRGELVRMAPTKNYHGEIAAYVTGSLVPHVRRNSLGKVYTGEAGFTLASDPAHVRVPDIGFVQLQNIERIGRPDSLWPEPPDLAIEVISPSDRYSDVEEKVFDYLEAGTQMVIVLESRTRTAKVYRSRTDVTVLTEAGMLDGADVVPGWSMPVSEIFD